MLVFLLLARVLSLYLTYCFSMTSYFFLTKPRWKQVNIYFSYFVLIRKTLVIVLLWLFLWKRSPECTKSEIQFDFLFDEKKNKLNKSWIIEQTIEKRQMLKLGLNDILLYTKDTLLMFWLQLLQNQMFTIQYFKVKFLNNFYALSQRNPAWFHTRLQLQRFFTGLPHKHR